LSVRSWRQIVLGIKNDGRGAAVLDCIAAHSPQGARRVPARIQAIIDLLLPYPLSALARAIHHPAHDI
jgi:hypothetical protein